MSNNQRLCIVGVALTLGACQGEQSALMPAGPAAGSIATLFWVLLIGGVTIFMFVFAVCVVALFGGLSWRRLLSRESFVVSAGLVFPIVTLSTLLVYGLTTMRSQAVIIDRDQAPLRIEVTGEQWWWRVVYRTGDNQRIESANEIRIPVGRPVEIALKTADVIHSFWVPNLAGKLDMIPGRTTVLTLRADQPGISRGQCAEYCGGAHALMSFYVVAMEPTDYTAWLAREEQDAAAPDGARVQQGMMLFLSYGCGACHTVRGTAATGTIGPDLTHVGGRLSLGAATLPNDQAAFARWIRDNDHIKPENRMPAFRNFSDSELAALSFYLAELQ